ncbi:MAG: cell division protein ZapA [Candidatus Puniceispirillaceae bacterium]
MSQSIVTIRLNGTPYQIGCGPGEEARIEALAAEIDGVLQSLVGSVGQIGEARLLAMAALILADRAQEGEASAPANGSPGDASGSEAAAAAALESAAERILALASGLSSH